MSKIFDFENLLGETGGCGRYQKLLTSMVHLVKTAPTFTQLFMVYGAAVPKWWCADGQSGNWTTSSSNESSLRQCDYVENGLTRKCSTFMFDDSMSTVVSEVWHDIYYFIIYYFYDTV